ncbi:hypothetical protein [Streptomyces sp. NPDC047718]|uniref:hypothetical protein n=1 Tax=Streptomyces sp. NPDC047718 TaxID=3155479 RepID=UPI0033CE992B
MTPRAGARSRAGAWSRAGTRSRAGAPSAAAPHPTRPHAAAARTRTTTAHHERQYP